MKLKFLLLPLAALAAAAPRAEAKIRVVATVPDLVDIVGRVGGDRVAVQGLARGTEDIHQIQMRPSFVTRLNRADAVVYLGMGSEHSFLPGLLEVARNPKMSADWTLTCAGSGCIDASTGVRVLQKPDTLSRAEGEIHPLGNPHYNMGADNGPVIARSVADGLKRVDPAHAKDYDANLKVYLLELDAKLSEWKKKAAPLKGVKAVSYHKDTAYLGRFTGIDFVDTVELKPGIAPTPTHLEKLVQKMKKEKVSLIVREQEYESKTSEWLARETGARIAVIGTMAGAFPETETFAGAIVHNLDALLTAAKIGKDVE